MVDLFFEVSSKDAPEVSPVHGTGETGHPAGTGVPLGPYPPL
jgi:hypothetical protein